MAKLKKRNLFSKSTKISAIIAFVLWVILNISGIQGLFFHDSSSFGQVAFVKILHLLFLFVVISVISRWIILSKNDVRYKDALKIASIYFIILVIILFFVWPGCWSWDDILVVENASFYSLTPWQHFLSGLFQILAAQTFPFPAGIILVQAFLSSLSVGYIVSFLGHRLSDKYKIAFRKILILLIAPFFMLPVLYFVLGGYRMSIYQYLEILLFALIVVLSNHKEKISSFHIVALLLLTILVGSWRTEGVFIVLVVPILLFLSRRKFFSIKRVLLFLLVTTISVLAIGKINTHLIGNDKYSIGSYISPLVANLRKGYADSEQIEIIDKVLDQDCLKDDPELPAEAIFNICIRDGYSQEEYSAFSRESLKIIVNHPRTTALAILELFSKTTGGTYNENGVPYAWSTAIYSSNLFVEGSESNALWSNAQISNKQPINSVARNVVINILAGTPNNKAAFYMPIFWNHIVPIILCAVFTFRSFRRKEWLFAVMGVSILCRVIIIACASMAPFFMYYMPVYVSSYVIFIYTTLKFLFDKKPKEELITIKSLCSYLFKKNQKRREIVTYLIFGILGFLISTVSYAICRKLGLDIAVSNVVSWILAVVFMFATNKKIVFQSKNKKKNEDIREFILFIVARVFTLFLETGVILLLIDVMHSSDLIAKCIGQVVVIVSNYILSKIFIFRKNN